jgi:hypothetical protein
MGALPQRFRANCGQCGLDGIGMTARCTELPRKALQCMQSCLAQPFTLVLEPVVTPVRQELTDEVSHVHRIQVTNFGHSRCLSQTLRERDEVMHINLNVVIKPQEGRGGDDYLLA